MYTMHVLSLSEFYRLVTPASFPVVGQFQGKEKISVGWECRFVRMRMRRKMLASQRRKDAAKAELFILP